jgi:N-acetylneuraminate synthase
VSTFVIAEAGVNHNGDLSLAKRLVHVASEAGADAVKFQSFVAADVASACAAQAPYQQENAPASGQLEMLRRLELGEDEQMALATQAAALGIEFLSTPFDLRSLALLTNRVRMPFVKVASGEATNAPFLLAVARSAPRVVLSTGMCTLEEVRRALGVLAFGFTAMSREAPSAGAFTRAFESVAGQRAVRERVVLLQCTTDYPSSAADANLRAMVAMREEFGTRVGYSDHTRGWHAAVAAVALGAEMIEKHFTLDRGLPGPDHAASLEPFELRTMVAQIRETESALGDGVKRPCASEGRNLTAARRGLVAAAPIATGETFTEANVAAKRPAGGLEPFSYWQLLGRHARRSYAVDEPIDVAEAGLAARSGG